MKLYRQVKDEPLLPGEWPLFPSYERAEDAERKVRAWDAAVALGEIEDVATYREQAARMRKPALNRELETEHRAKWDAEAVQIDELAAALRAIEKANEQEEESV